MRVTNSARLAKRWVRPRANSARAMRTVPSVRRAVPLRPYAAARRISLSRCSNKA